MKKKLNLKILFFCFFISLIVLFFTSKSSPFYPFNDWVDVNAFMTVGKSMVKGIIPYKDIFEQKGPILYFIYSIASLISNTSFIGVFILEVIIWTFTLYFCYLMARMFISKKLSILLLPVFLLIMTTTKSFTHGSSCEEFMFLCQSITLYYFIRHLIEKELNYKEFAIIGIIAGIVLLMKYTLLGLWLAFQMIVTISYIKNKSYQKAFSSCIYFLLGISIPLVIILLYFGLNNGLNEFINVYFVINMTSYTKSVSFILRPFSIIGVFFETLVRNNIIVILLVLSYPLLICNFKIDKLKKVSLILIFIFTIFGIFYGLVGHVYYVLPVNFFLLFSLISLFTFIKDKLINKKFYMILSMVVVTTFICSYLFSNNRSFHNIKKEDLFQYKFAEIIKNDPEATMVNMGFLDCGVYTLANIYPTTYYFELQNFKYENYPDNTDEFSNYIKNKETKYIVYIKKNKDDMFLESETLFKNYDIIIDETEYTFENNLYYAYLWRVKE